jgi:dienelactone hydrolase
MGMNGNGLGTKQIHPMTTSVAAVPVRVGNILLDGITAIPSGYAGVVVIAHGSGSSRFSPRNQLISRFLNEAGLATLLVDLLTAPEEAVDRRTRHLRSDVPMLADRLTGTVDWVRSRKAFSNTPIGLFGSGSGTAAALIAAAERPEVIEAVGSHGGRPDLLGELLIRVRAPVLFLIGDGEEIVFNRGTNRRLLGKPEMEILAGASHLFEEPGKLEEAARLTCRWFQKKLCGSLVG